jgi:tetratricopeptide (TPR) repeat protein
VRAKALPQLERSDEAIQHVREALRLDPNFWEARSFLGEELAFAGHVTEAQREFEAVLRLKPDHRWAHLNLGVALFKQGRRAEAVRQFEEMLRLDPQLLPAKQYLEQLNSQPSSKP